MKTQTDHFNELRILHTALCIGASLTIIIFHFFIKPINLEGIMDTLNLSSMLGLGVGFLSIFSAITLFNKRTADLGATINSDNFIDYKAAYVLSWSLIEGAILINTLLYFFEDVDPINIILAILLLFMLYLKKPRMAV